MRTFLFPALAICFLVSCANPEEPDSARNGNPESDFEFQIEKRGVVITAYTGGSPDVVIPRRIQGRPVTEIGDGAFNRWAASQPEWTPIGSVVIPNTVTRIGARAFQHSGLASVVIPPGVTVIENCAFSDNRLTSVTIPKGVTRIEDYAFCGNELVSLDFPRGLASIGEYAFSSNKLERLVLPPGLKWVDVEAFGNNQLSELELPASLERIGDFAFENNRLGEIKLPARLWDIGHFAFYQNNISSLTIPASVKYIGRGAFGQNPLSRVTIISREPLFTEGTFHHNLPEFLPAGTYVKGEDENWFRREEDGSLLDFPLYYQKLAEEDPAALPYLIYAAIGGENAALLRHLIPPGSGMGALAYADSFFGVVNPLAQLIRRQSLYDNYLTVIEINEEIAALLLEEGAVPERWMLACSYFQRGLTKMLLEHGALENRPNPGSRSEEYPDPPALLMYYIDELSDNREGNLRIVGAAAELLAYGVDPGLPDPETRKTPLVKNLQRTSSYSPEMTALLLEYLPRPLSLEEYRLLAGINKEAVYPYPEEGVDREHEDKRGYDALILEDVKKGLLDPLEQDDRAQTSSIGPRRPEPRALWRALCRPSKNRAG
jgi:hypothetical protein